MNHGSPVLFMVVGVHGGKSNLLLAMLLCFCMSKGSYPHVGIGFGVSASRFGPTGSESGAHKLIKLCSCSRGSKEGALHDKLPYLGVIFRVGHSHIVYRGSWRVNCLGSMRFSTAEVLSLWAQRWMRASPCIQQTFPAKLNC